MLSVVKSQGATVANRALPMWCQTTATPNLLNPGILQDVAAASFQIYSSKGVQIYPSHGGDKQTVNLVTQRIDTGYYAAVWDSSHADIGEYTIRWYVTPIAAGAEENVFEQDFEVVTVPYRSRNYCSVESLRIEGVTSARLSDIAVQRHILQASRYVEMFTGRVFCPVPKVIRIDGTNGRGISLEEPIVAIQGLAVSLVSQFTASDLQVLADTFRVYNRHLTLGLLNPDDRDNPHLEFVHDDDLKGVNYVVPTSGYRLTQLIWPKGQQNCRIEGVFGYTEPDGSWWGRTPELIQLVTKMLCFRYLDRLGTSLHDDAIKRGRVISEHTKDQGYTLSHPSSFNAYTGDTEIDTILVNFTRPPKFGAV
jgi:hypothetical protein